MQVARCRSRNAVAAATVVGVSTTLAWAGTGTTSFNVSATVINHCTISSRKLSFARHELDAASLSTRGAITARCTKGDAVTIALNHGGSPVPGLTAAEPAQRIANGASNDLPNHVAIVTATVTF